LSTNCDEIFRVSSHWAYLDVIKFLAPNSHGKWSPKGKIFVRRFVWDDIAEEQLNLAR